MLWGKRGGALCAGLSLMTGCVTETKVVPPDSIPPNLVKPAAVRNDRQAKPETLVAAGMMYIDQGVASKDNTARQQYYEQARRVFQQAQAKDPGNLQAVQGLARVADKQGQTAAANQLYEQLAQQCPRDANLQNEYGWFLARNKQWAQAAGCFQRACDLDPTNAKFASDLGHTLARAERFEESCTVFRRHMSEGQACYRVALMAKHLKREDVCKHFAQLALQSEPQLQDAKQMLADLASSDPKVMTAGGVVATMPATLPAAAPSEPTAPMPPQP